MSDNTPQRRDELAQALAAVHRRIDAACVAADRDPAALTLVVVTKFFPVTDLATLIDLGVTDVGENRHQEAAEKFAELSPERRDRVRTHFIGQLQSNKASAVARYADVVQSLDREKLVGALDRGAQQHDRVVDVTLQVDLAGDDAGRGGVAPAAVPALAEAVAAAQNLRLRGLMAVAPLDADPAAAFEQLRGIHEQVLVDHPEATWLSAGMSGDLEQAVAAGATHLRVGSAILGSRPTPR